MPLTCNGEIHESGGPGMFFLARTETAFEGLLAEYRGKIQLIYLDIMRFDLIQGITAA